jgi:outer membrane protein OmpA-like peptidoglycan-associated protein
MRFSQFTFIILLCTSTISFAQKSIIEGYIYEDNNRGYINQVKVKIAEDKNGFERGETYTDREGFFSIEVPEEGIYRITGSKDIYHSKIEKVTVKAGEKTFVKIEMSRKPGYIFNMTLAKRRTGNEPVDAIEGAKVEVYNNTLKKSILSIDSASHDFSFNMEQGNHYTCLIRKKGYFNKRLEAYVNVKGCILCLDGVEGVSQSSPTVTDNLTQGFQIGTLVANLDMQPLVLNSSVRIENLYYDLGKYDLRPQSIKELEKIVSVLKINPAIQVELGSHTDSRGDDASNMNLSQQRAEAVVSYLISQGISASRMSAKGFGETQLVNGCTNGVVCPDSEHQQNRRTQLKITGIGKDSYADKALSEILQDEELERFMKEDAKQQVIEVKEGDDMPEELKKYIESQKKGGGNQSSISTENKTTTITEPINQTVKVETKKDEPKTEVKTEPKTGMVSNAKINTILKEKVSAQKGKTEIKSSKSNEDEMPEVTTTKFVDKTSVAHKTALVTSDFNGFSVEIIKSKKEISATNELFYRYPTVFLDKRDKDVAYLVGIAEAKKDIETTLKEVQVRYPKAKIVRYSRGLVIE